MEGVKTTGKLAHRPWVRHYAPGVRNTLEYPLMPWYRILDLAAQRWPRNTAVIFLGKKYTYTEIQTQANAFAAALRSLGIQPGDRVALMMPNIPQMVVAIFGTLKAGAIAVPTNPLYTERELEHQLRDSGARAIVVLDMMYPKVEAVRWRTSLEHVIVTGIPEALPFPLNVLFPLKAKREGTLVKVPKAPHIKRFSSLVQRFRGQSAPEVPVDPQRDVAILLYTGGTTGLSKGAMLSHFNLVANAYQTREWLGPEGRELEGKGRVMCLMPFFHSYGLTTCLATGMLMGATLILIPRMDLKLLLKLINKYQPHIFPGAPPVYNAINNAPDIHKYNLRSIRYCISGAAALPVEVQQKFEQLTGGKLVEGYGLTECSPVTHANPLQGLRKIGSIGIPVPDTDCKIVDVETGTEELDIGQEGELCIRGPQVMLGYWNRPDETAKTLRDGWLYTGDIAKVDEDGFFYIVDRKKDMIIVSGYNVYPREVEEVLYEHPAVLEAAVIGVPHEHKGEVVKAFVVLKPGMYANEEDIKAFCRQRLAPYKVPVYVEFRQELPKSLIGKVLRRHLREEEQARGGAPAGR